MPAPARPRVAIPVPTSSDFEYNQRCWLQYAEAVATAGGDAVKVPLSLSAAQIVELAKTCEAILLPGSPADVSPQKYGQLSAPETADADPARENVDELLLQEAYHLRKPVLAICFGAQILNVWLGGTLLQHLTVLPVNHEAGKSVAVAHTAAVAPNSLLGSLVPPEEVTQTGDFVRLPVNSSHHQAIGILGDGLIATARCPQDGIIEAVECIHCGDDLGNPDLHFVLGIQWHPERSVTTSPTSRKVFAHLVARAAAWTQHPIHASTI